VSWVTEKSQFFPSLLLRRMKILIECKVRLYRFRVKKQYQVLASTFYD